MFLWFAGLSFALVWLVFRSPALDYRLVMLGSVLPLLDVAFGGARYLHTLVAGVAVLVLIVLATTRKRLVRRRWIGLPIGMLMHLVLDGIWTRTAVFWWPFFGWGFDDKPVPELGHGLLLTLLAEVVGAAALWWCWTTFELGNRSNRTLFLRTGHLNRSVAAG
jgi:membrane-bound metal-dependent hydrolase YbcI (DUF457 family)